MSDHSVEAALERAIALEAKCGEQFRLAIGPVGAEIGEALDNLIEAKMCRFRLEMLIEVADELPKPPRVLA